MSEATFDQLERAVSDSGPQRALDLLVDTLRNQKEYHRLFDALIVRKRHEMGLPLVNRGKLTDLPENLQKQFEDYYVEACREVGSLYLDQGNIPHAWLYMNTIGEPQPVAEAIDKLAPGDVDDEIIEVAFQQGANQRKGFEFILRRYGTCSAITCFEQLAQAESNVLEHCAGLLLHQLHGDLIESLRRDIEAKEGTAPAGECITQLVEGRDWLFGEMSYHVDTSHLSSVVRFCRLLDDPGDLALAVELTDYGRRLCTQFQFPGEPPFENAYEDHRIYFRTLLGRDVEAGIDHFRAKLAAAEAEKDEQSASDQDSGPLMPEFGAGHDDRFNPEAEVLVGLLARLGRYDEAVAVSLEHLKGDPVGRNGTPTLAELCRRAGDFSSLAKASRRQGDLVNFTAALVEARESKPTN